MHRRTLLVIALVCSACGDDDGSSEVADDQGGAVVPDNPQPAGAGPDASDAGSPGPQEQQPADMPVDAPQPAVPEDMSDVESTVAGDLSTGGTCNAVCQAEGLECNPGCGEEGRTHAGVSVHVDENGAGPEREVASCETDVPAETIQSGFPVELGLFSCCCRGPWWTRVTEVRGDAATRESCSVLCQAEGLVCDNEHNWGLGETGGARVEMVDGAVTRLLYLPCGAMPNPDLRDNGRTYALRDYTCACGFEPPADAPQPEPPPTPAPGGEALLYEDCVVDGECQVGLFCSDAGYCTRSCEQAFDCPPPGNCNLVQRFCAL